MLCPICGQDHKEGTAFCENCGHPLNRPAPVAPSQHQAAPTQTVTQHTGELPGKALGIVGLILGILSILGCCCLFFLSLPSGIAGIVLSSISMKQAKQVGRRNNLALAGLICSIVGLVMLALFLVMVLLIQLLEAYG